MEENPSNQDVLLIADEQQKDVNVLKNVEDEEFERVGADKKHQGEFMRIERGGTFVENFFKNFVRQFDDPSRFTFFLAPIDKALDVADSIKSALKSNKPNWDNEVKRYRLDENGRLPRRYGYDVGEIDWETLKPFGITQESLKASENLEAMLRGDKSPKLVPITLNLGDVRIQAEARLSFRRTEEGKVTLNMSGVKREPDLESKFYGHTFTDEEKQELRSTGNLGKVVELTDFRSGEMIPSYVSLDRLTNDVVAVRTDRVRMPSEIKGVTLTDEQKEDLLSGKAVYVENMTSASGKAFNAHIQFNADRRGIEFRFDDRQRQQSKSDREKMYIPHTVGGVKLTKEQQTALREGGTVYLENMTNRQGKVFSSYVSMNKEERRLTFSSKKPVQKQDGQTERAAGQEQKSANGPKQRPQGHKL